MGRTIGDELLNLARETKARMEREGCIHGAGGNEQVGTIEKKVPVECWTRVVGYLRPVGAFNIAKKQEFKDRKVYDVKEYRQATSREERVQNPA